MLKEFEDHIAQNFLSLKYNQVLVACSGGLDSVVLTYLLHKLNINITLAHCNFSLRGKESDADEKFVVELAKDFEVPVYTETFDTEAYASENKVSIQMAARKLRYNWFAELIELLQLDMLVTAHHLDDDLETFLINTSRGTGLKGLTGIPEINENIIRPLLPFSRDEILSYAKQNNISWREDSSNKSNKYIRNKIRLEVIPKLKEENPQLLGNFKTTQSHLKSSQALIDDYMSLVFKLAIEETAFGYKIDIGKLKSLPNTKAVLYALLNHFGFTEWNDVYDLLSAQSGKKVVSKTHVLLKDREHLLLKENNPSRKNTLKNEYLITVDIKSINEPINLKIGEVSEISQTGKDTVYLDKDKLEYPLVLRKWQPGDVFFPFGLNGKKKLSKVFKEEKLSLFSKQNIWLLCSNNKIVWVVGIRPDDRFKVTDSTTTILKIQYQK